MEINSKSVDDIYLLRSSLFTYVYLPEAADSDDFGPSKRISRKAADI